MRNLSSNKKMPSIQRKPTRKFKGISSVAQSTNQILHEVNQLIFKIELLPLIFEFQANQYKQMSLSLSNTSVTIKNGTQTSTITMNLGKNKWMRIIFDQEIKNVEIKCNSTENKLEKNQIYTKYQSWKAIFKQQTHNLYLQPLYSLLKNKNEKKDKLVDIPPKTSLTSFMKTRFSQRNNIKHSLLPFRTKNETHSKITENQNHNKSINQHPSAQKGHQSDSIIKMQSQRVSSTLQIQKDSAKIQTYYNMKQSNTSTSISVQHQLKFSKRLRRIRDIVDLKIAKSQKQVMFDNTSDFFQLKQRPKFYQHFNLSQQQIEIKRKKFDSQFICKKEILPSLFRQTNTNIQKNQSEVTQDICKIQRSKQSNLFEDTLQKGFIGNKQNGADLQESGTLYESVYE